MCLAFEEEREEGREEGREENRKFVIHNMRKKNYSMEEISDITGCSVDEIQNILKDNELVHT